MIFFSNFDCDPPKYLKNQASLPVSEASFVFLWSSSVKGLSERVHLANQGHIWKHLIRHLNVTDLCWSVLGGSMKDGHLTPITDEDRRNTNQTSLTGKLA